MFKSFFKKSEPISKTVELKAHVSGTVVSLEEVPDPVFSQKMMGDGIAIVPTEGKVVSPVEGEVIQVFPTKHAIGLKAQNGAEILIHIGLETVSMNGAGFTAHVSEGEKVKQGDVLVTFDISLVKEKAKSTVTPMIITNSNDMVSIIKGTVNNVTAGKETILTVEAK